MKILTSTEGRRRLGYWLKRATEGEDVGFLFEGKIVALRPVEVVSTDYALQEYGLTKKEMAKAARAIKSSVASERRRGTLKAFTGKVRLVKKHGYTVAAGTRKITQAEVRKALDEFP
jgi:hypothetical protein